MQLTSVRQWEQSKETSHSLAWWASEYPGLLIGKRTKGFTGPQMTQRPLYHWKMHPSLLDDKSCISGTSCANCTQLHWKISSSLAIIFWLHITLGRYLTNSITCWASSVCPCLLILFRLLRSYEPLSTHKKEQPTRHSLCWFCLVLFVFLSTQPPVPSLQQLTWYI